MQLELINDQQPNLVSELIQLREQFVIEYCTKKNWDKSNLNFEQISEIRSHNVWKNPLMLQS